MATAILVNFLGPLWAKFGVVLGLKQAPGIVGSWLYDITIGFGPKNMSLEKYILISQKNNHHGCSYESLYRVD